jgi:hypothetical protein
VNFLARHAKANLPKNEILLGINGRLVKAASSFCAANNGKGGASCLGKEAQPRLCQYRQSKAGSGLRPRQTLSPMVTK